MGKCIGDVLQGWPVSSPVRAPARLYMRQQLDSGPALHYLPCRIAHKHNPHPAPSSAADLNHFACLQGYAGSCLSQQLQCKLHGLLLGLCLLVVNAICHSGLCFLASALCGTAWEQRGRRWFASGCFAKILPSAVASRHVSRKNPFGCLSSATVAIAHHGQMCG